MIRGRETSGDRNGKKGLVKMEECRDGDKIYREHQEVVCLEYVALGRYNVITRLVNEETRQAGTFTRGQCPSSDANSVAFAKKKTDPSRITCFACGEKGHYRSDCSQWKDFQAKKKPTGPANAVFDINSLPDSSW